VANQKCPVKHTAYQPADEDWVCPVCGINDEFYIDEQPEKVLDGCVLLHEQDRLVCTRCEGGWSGKAWANRAMKQRNFVVCPTCRGTGHIDQNKQEKP